LDETCVRTAEEWITQVIHPNSAGGPLPCVSAIFLGKYGHGTDCQFIQTPSEVPGSYGENWPRLQEVKNTFDPDHFFRHAMWPLPADKEAPKRNDKGKQRASGPEIHAPVPVPASDAGAAKIVDDLIMPSIAAADVNEVEGLAKNRHDAIRDTPLSGVKEHKINVPSEHLGLEETIRAAASSS
jgi:hypothetical protein